MESAETCPAEKLIPVTVASVTTIFVNLLFILHSSLVFFLRDIYLK
jgi:hypothetical protein